MDDIKVAIQKYINDKKELYKHVLQIIEKADSADDRDFQNLINFLTAHQYEGNKPEIKHFLHLILNIANNHQRQPNFFETIEKILTHTSKFYKTVFSSLELFTIFQESKQILLFLLRTKMIIIDQILFNYLLTFTYSNQGSTYYYFYPELNSIIETRTIEGIESQNYQINNSDDFSISDFETNRQKGENDYKLCSIIRDDLIDDFIQYVHQTNISLSSEIKRSIFETNPILNEKEPTLIEYATFFGSIKIMKYLEINKVELNSSLWLYAVHSDNPEAIQFLEDKKIEIDDMAFSESIKCHHNSIANYIYENYFDSSMKITDLSEDIVSTIYSSANYEFFSEEIDCNKVFFSLCQNEYNELVELYLKFQSKIINDYISKNNGSNKRTLISKALNDNRIDVAYSLLKEFDCIPDKYFRDSNITKIALPSTIKSISNYAFDRCSSLTQISIPPSVTLIGQNAFNQCKSLKQIVIPLSVTSIGQSAFYECKSLTQISIPPSVTSIDEKVFSLCSSLKKIIISPLATKFNYASFYKCSSLSEIAIPPSVKSIESNIFRECFSLKHASIPSSVKTFKENFFCDCPNLESISIIQCNEKIIDCLEGNFLVCKSDLEKDVYDTLLWVKPTLETVVVPSFIKIIDKGACWGCRSLKEITIPSTVTKIDSHVFYRCESLTNITIHSSITIIGVSLFNKCSSLTQFTIPSSVTKIDIGAFSSCRSLTQITIPPSVTKIDSNAFASCTSLTRITIPSSIIKIKSGVFSECTSLTQVILPSSITEIGFCAFSGCTSLTHISIPSSVTEIKSSAFNNCTSLAQILLPSSLIKIGSSAFKNCISLTQILIPASVTEIEKYAFKDCTSLEQISIPSIIDISNLNIPSTTKITKI